MKINKILLLDKNIILIANRLDFETNEKFVDNVAFQLENGANIVLLKTNDVSANDLLAVGKIIRELCSIYNSLFFVQSRLDIAMLVHADGVHLLKNDVEPVIAREFLGNNVIIGLDLEDKIDEIFEDVDFLTSKTEIRHPEIPCYIKEKENNKIIYKKI